MRGDMNEKIKARHESARAAAHREVTENGGNINTAIHEAVETATRVRITDEAVRIAYFGDYGLPSQLTEEIINKGRVRLAAALAELGFEVEE